jgi:DNA mismatch repair protein MutL
MPSKIRVLDEHTINKIAAGEVIENPSSVVKELVENSLDAGATDICIEIKGGGRQLIRITDNGCGMNRDDALLCLERHATSKIREVEDILAIGTMGFRGEAIPSIASISKFTLITSDDSSGVGTLLLVEAGKVLQCTNAARSQGTTIEVKSLFFNVPVRKKFQKSPVYDANEILKVITSIAMGYPHIKFQLISDQKSLLQTPMPTGSTFQELLGERVQAILGNDFFDSTCFVDGSCDEYKLEGYVGQPAFTRHNRTGQYLFINKRAVVSPLVNFAVREGFGTMLATNRHPVFVLHLSVPGAVVDVNVHPQKREVRIRQEHALKEMIVAAVSKAIQGNHVFAPDVSLSQPFVSHHLPSESLEHEPPKSFTGVSFKETEIQFEPYVPQATKLVSHGPSYLPPILKMSEPKVVSEVFLPMTMPENRAGPKVIATLKHYIVLEGNQKDAFVLADPRAMHARIIYEQLLRRVDQRISVQSLLIPYTFEVTPIEGALFLDHLESFNLIGVSIRQSGPNTFLVDSIPTIFGNSDMRALLTEITNSMKEIRDHIVFKKEQERQLAIAASRAAISNKRRLSIEEAQSLVDQLMACESPNQCPQGKPTMAAFSLDEISARFERRGL